MNCGGLFACAFAAVAAWATPSQAVPLSFVLAGDDNASWVLDSNPAPAGSVSGVSFWFSGIGPAQYLIFYSSSSSGGITAGDSSDGFGSNLFELTGAQLYTGPENSPAFLTGTFVLNGLLGTESEGRIDTLTISATPLPAAWMLFLTALTGIFGWRISRQRI